MKQIQVVAAIIVRDAKLLATQRGYGDYAGSWEFPGGKIEPGETPEQALIREIHEELDARIEIKEHLITVSHDYPTFSATLHCYICRLIGEMTLLEHSDAKWLSRDDLYSVEWLAADLDVLKAIVENGLI